MYGLVVWLDVISVFCAFSSFCVVSSISYCYLLPFRWNKITKITHRIATTDAVQCNFWLHPPCQKLWCLLFLSDSADGQQFSGLAHSLIFRWSWTKLLNLLLLFCTTADITAIAFLCNSHEMFLYLCFILVVFYIVFLYWIHLFIYIVYHCNQSSLMVTRSQ